MIYIDFETYSECDITVEGGKKYANHPSTQIVCLAYAFDNEPVELWNVGKPVPKLLLDRIAQGEKVYAFNIMFDYRIWNIVGHRDFSFPLLTLEQLVDVQALCCTYQLPQNLDDACHAMSLTNKKLSTGKALIKKCCVPDKKGNQPLPDTLDMRRAFNDLFKYCAMDVESMRELVNKVPRQELIPREQPIWMMTQEMNEQGLPIDINTVHLINGYLDKYIEESIKVLPTWTDGQITKPTQTARIKTWCERQNFPIPNVQAETLEHILERDDVPPNIRRVLELRQEFGSTSVAKFKKIIAQEYNGWVYDNLRYHGAGTGRWTGQGFQMHNLPRAKTDDPESLIQQFKEGVVENPVYYAKTLIRPIVRAPEGKTFMVADYSAIENYLLAWAAGDYSALDLLVSGKSQYIDMAAARFNVPYDQVTDGQKFLGKQIILGCGYGMGGKKFKETAKLRSNIDMTLEEATDSVYAYRGRYPLVKELWAELRKAATRAVITGEKQTYLNTTFGVFTRNKTRWLAMQLPTDKSIYYMSPTIKEELIPDYEYMGTVPTITHWGLNPYSKKWSRLKLIPGRITENFVQGLAREVMAQGLLNVKQHMPHVTLLGSVHDEAISLIEEKYATQEVFEEFCFHLCNVDFIPGCPLKAEGYFSKRYKKE